ncbi:MAG: LysM peptidoglycan-binding domain-containing protein [Planctomycetes bacterium]|nr:LysM peptidoglycan-binding domain-containing protein [Planctomycetota bacterium]
MRVAIWVALLVAAFVLAWQIQERWAEARRAERDAAYGRVSSGEGNLPEGFGRVIVGAPSGADPIERPRPAPTSDEEHETEAGGSTGRAAQGQPDARRLRRHVVQRGDSLSEICAAAYGTSRKAVVDAVARANALPNPGAIREGQELVLPPLEELSSPPR